MNRRRFLQTGVGGAVAGALAPSVSPSASGSGSGTRQTARGLAGTRAQFPRLAGEVFLNAAGGTPLSTFAEAGLRRYEDFWRLGPADGRREYFDDMLGEVRGGFAHLIGARAAGIAFVQSTKAAEQIVLDGLPRLRDGGNVVTNDLHFSGSLHNLIGLRAEGLDVRIVRARDWRIDVDDMAAAMDDDTALVSVTLLSNVNGHIEQMRAIADLAHARGAYVYADIIQAAGIIPIDVHAMGIDFAGCNGYKWLYGPHGTGFLYVGEEHQGTALEDHLFPGNTQLNYGPWASSPASGEPDYSFRPRADAQRYQPGHVSYLGYAAVHEGIRFVERHGIDAMLGHCVGLNQRLLDRLDPERYECISPDVERSPIIAFIAPGVADLQDRLGAADVVVAVAPGNRMRVSPAVYNDEADIDALVETLNRA